MTSVQFSLAVVFLLSFFSLSSSFIFPPSSLPRITQSSFRLQMSASPFELKLLTTETLNLLIEKMTSCKSLTEDPLELQLLISEIRYSKKLLGQLEQLSDGTVEICNVEKEEDDDFKVKRLPGKTAKRYLEAGEYAVQFLISFLPDDAKIKYSDEITLISKSNKDHIVQILEKYHGKDKFLPEAFVRTEDLLDEIKEFQKKD
jgi:hypothetical protein